MKDIQYNKTSSILDDTKQIIETAQSFAYQSINIALVKRNWLLGKRIAEEILQGDERAKYGSEFTTVPLKWTNRSLKSLKISLL